MNEPRMNAPKVIAAGHVHNGRPAGHNDRPSEPDLGLASSVESANKSEQLAERLRGRILDLVRKAGTDGLTINEAERQIEDHKGHSVSPRFSELFKQGALVRILLGRGTPTRRFPLGSPRYFTRYDEETRRNVTVHWAPEFTPAPSGKYCGLDQSPSRDANSDATSIGPLEIEGVHV
jgi:hypothetical protein